MTLPFVQLWAKPAKKRADVRLRQSELGEFEARFEALANLLSEAFAYGPMPEVQADYRELREGLSRLYRPVRPFLVTYLEPDPEDARLGLRLAGYSTDAFEALVVESDLDRLLEEDANRLAAQIARVREAIARYGDHLRWLAARGT